MDVVGNVIANVLTAIYQPFWTAVVMSVLVMYFYIFSTDDKVKSGQGWKRMIKLWLEKFKNSKRFRSVFFMVFYTTMILFRTLLNRNMWMNPVAHVMDGWWIFKENLSTGAKELTTECIENLILFIPFSFMVLYNFSNQLIKDKKHYGLFIWLSLKISFISSLTIELLQLFLRLGTFQLSDIFYNTLGGILGGGMFLCYEKLHMRFAPKTKEV